MWEGISSVKEGNTLITTDRLRVPGGWVVRSMIERKIGAGRSSTRPTAALALAVAVNQVFVSDHEQKWKL